MKTKGQELFHGHALLLLTVYSLFNSLVFSQNQDKGIESKDSNQDLLFQKERVMFYNVENLFDVFNDSLTNDDEFTPEGERHWNNTKFYKKLNNISKVIISIGEWNPPAIVGFSEVENRFVLNKLIYETPLKKFDYNIIHIGSPDRRGIDVAMLYRESRFDPIAYTPIRINFPDDSLYKTRDILYVKGILAQADTVHFFVNHWPSRYGGYEDSKPRRMFVASVLKHKVDSLCRILQHPNIIIMGDFNDEPRDESIHSGLSALTDTAGMKPDDLVNLMAGFHKTHVIGTNKYKENWGVIDQFIVSGNLLNGKNNIHISTEGAKIYQESFLLEKDDMNLGLRPNRTYIGPVYHGGFSDHLPIYLDINISHNEIKQ